jgi:hypothetical protein
MESKTARLTLLIDPDKKAAFERLCALQDRTASQVVRQLIRDYLAQHGVEFQPGGGPGDPPSPAPAAPSPARADRQPRTRGTRRKT